MHEDGVAAAESVMTFVSYAQNFEDVLLWRALADVENGRYIDIGAQHPVIDSVSLAFYKAGWRGIHVEPTPYYAGLLREARPDETVIEAAVTDAQGPIDFYEIVGTGLSTGSRNIAHHHGPLGFEQRQLTVPCVRLDRLLEAAGDTAHWIKIDVEGMEADVLRSWGESAARPWVLVIESTFPNSQTPTHQNWIHDVLDRGYIETFYDGLSRYFVHESQRERQAAFEAPANIFDDFVITHDHFSGRSNRIALEQAEERSREYEASSARLSEQLAGAERQLADERATTADLEHRLATTAQSLSAMSEQAIGAANELAQAEANRAAIAQQLAEAAERYAAAIETVSLERQAAETSLREQLDESRATAAATEIQLVRIEERATWLQDTLRRTEEERDRTIREGDERRGELAAELDRYRAAVAQIRSALMRADALIRGAQRRPGRWRQLGQLLGLSPPPFAWRALADWSLPATDDPNSFPATKVVNQETTETMQNPTAPEARNPYLRANSLAELLAWNDVDFVRCAYVTILGRQPDAEGEAYYTDRIRRGHSKFEVLWQLRRSAEGPGHDPGIAGLDRALKMAAWQRRPTIGWPLRVCFGGEASDRTSKRHRAVLNEVARVQLEQERQAMRLGDIVAKLAHLIDASAVPMGNPAHEPQSAAKGDERAVANLATVSKIDAALDSRARYALQLLQIEASAA
jgi:FkbM family methyltransferase